MDQPWLVKAAGDKSGDSPSDQCACEDEVSKLSEAPKQDKAAGSTVESQRLLCLKYESKREVVDAEKRGWGKGELAMTPVSRW